MDPLSAVGLATGILQFIEFAWHLTSGTIEIYRNGTTKENAHLSNVIDDLCDLSDDLDTGCLGNSKHDKALKRLAVNCASLSEELLGILEKLKASEKNPKWGALVAKWNGMRKRADIVLIAERLGEYRSQILLRLAMLMSDQQSAVKSRLDGIQIEGQKLAAARSDELRDLRREIVGMLEDLKLQHDPDTSGTTIVDSLTTLRSVAEILPREACILRTLFFDSMYSREDAIRDAEAGTFKWILGEATDDSMYSREDAIRDAEAGTFKWILGEATDGSQDNLAGSSPTSEVSESSSKKPDPRSEATAKFSDWLATNADIFHISGKAGSGKSTLMKFICQDPLIRQRLQAWAGSSRLAVSQYFFWHSGDDLQRSLHGLYRSILFDVLRQSPGLIPLVFPEQWRMLAAGGTLEVPAVTASLFRPPKITESFDRLIKQCSTANQALCLFIDGLDEYRGDSMDHWALAADLKAWSHHRNIRICVSSRPHTEYMATFSEASRIHLHAINKPDIEAYCRHEFEVNQHLGQASRPPEDLVDSIVSRSEGVFLWARLVVRSLLSSIGRLDTEETLRLKLEDIPSDLDLLYDQILSSLDAVDRRRADRLLMIVLHNPFRLPLNALIVEWVDELKNPDFPMADRCCFYPAEELTTRHERLRRQVYGITKGLVELLEGDPVQPFFQLKLQFFHTSVHTYLTEHRKLDSWDESIGVMDEAYARLRLAELLFARALGCHPPSRMLDDLSDVLQRLGGQLSARTLRKFHSVMHDSGGNWRILPTLGSPLSLQDGQYRPIATLDEISGVEFARFVLSIGRSEFIAEKIPDSTAVNQISAGRPRINLFLTALTSCLKTLVHISPDAPLDTGAIDLLRNRGAWLDSPVQVMKRQTWNSLVGLGRAASNVEKVVGEASRLTGVEVGKPGVTTITMPRVRCHTVTAWAIFLAEFTDRVSRYVRPEFGGILRVVYQSNAGPILRRQSSLLRFLLERDSVEADGGNHRCETVLLFSHNPPCMTRHLWDAPGSNIAWQDYSFQAFDVNSLMDAVLETGQMPNKGRPPVAGGLAETAIRDGRAANNSHWGRPPQGNPLPAWASERLGAKGVVLNPLKLSALEDLALARYLVWVITKQEAIRIRDFVYRVW